MGTVMTMGTAMVSTPRNRPDRRSGVLIDWRRRWRSVLRRGAVLVSGGFLFAVTLSSSVAGVMQAARPAVALSWNPEHAGASAGMAHKAIATNQFEDGRRLAIRAISRNPLNTHAYSALALAEEGAGRPIRARQLMGVAHSISARDRVAQIWQIRQAALAGDRQAMVRHFDILMRISRRGVGDIMSLLVAATADRSTVAALAPVLARNPFWKTSFLMTLSIGGPNVDHVVELIRGRLDPREADERAVMTHLIQRLVNEGRYDLAWSIYREARPGTSDAAASSIRDSTFAVGADFPPFDWQLSDEAGLTAQPEARRDGGPGVALALIAEGGRGGEVGRQLIRLTPGVQYELEFDAGATPPKTAEWRSQLSLACADGGEAFYQLRPSRSGAGPERVRGMFTVQGECRWQMLSIGIESNESPAEFPWIANIAIRR